MRHGLVGSLCALARRGSRCLLLFGILMVMVGASLMSVSRQPPPSPAPHASDALSGSQAQNPPEALSGPQPQNPPVALSEPRTQDPPKALSGPKAQNPPDALGGPDGYALDAFVGEPLLEEAQDKTVALVQSAVGAVRPRANAAQPKRTTQKRTPRALPNPLQVRYARHQVLRGQTLSTIAQTFRVDTKSIESVNRIRDPHRVRPGQVLLVPSRRGLMHVVNKDDTLEDIALEYKIPIEAITSANGISNPNAIYVNQKLFLPNATLPNGMSPSGRTSSRTTLARKQSRAQTWIAPIKSRVSSGYGYRRHPITGRRAMHRGIDFACGTGAAIQAVRAGRITYAGPLGSYGNLVVIDHGDGYETRYAHASRILLPAGKRVQRGDKIALSGSTGSSTGPHLHFEVRLHGKAINPVTVLR